MPDSLLGERVDGNVGHLGAVVRVGEGVSSVVVKGLAEA